jgi:hypothetical protein
MVCSHSITISMPRHRNGRARHATTLKHPRCPDPGSRSDHGGERADFQSSLALANARSEPCPKTRAVADAFAESSLEFALPHARPERCPTRPNTRAVADAFAGSSHQRTEHAARLDAAARRAAAHGRPSGANRTPFCFPIPDRSLALALRVRVLPCTKVRGDAGKTVGAVHRRAIPEYDPRCRRPSRSVCRLTEVIGPYGTGPASQFRHLSAPAQRSPGHRRAAGLQHANAGRQRRARNSNDCARGRQCDLCGNRQASANAPGRPGYLEVCVKTILVRGERQVGDFHRTLLEVAITAIPSKACQDK